MDGENAICRINHSRDGGYNNTTNAKTNSKLDILFFVKNGFIQIILKVVVTYINSLQYYNINFKRM